MRLYFLRHGQTDYNLNHIVQGGGIDSDLNETGQKQARAFYDAYQHLSFDAVYASPLKRTHQTLAPWVTAGYQYEIEIGLKEFNWGNYEGKRPSPDEHENYKQVIQRWHAGEIDLRVAEGETLREAWHRAEPFFGQLPQRHPRQQILLCSHGRQLRILLCQLLKRPYKEMERFNHGNTGLTVLEYEEDGKFELVSLNNTQHLDTLFA